MDTKRWNIFKKRDQKYLNPTKMMGPKGFMYSADADGRGHFFFNLIF